MERTRWIGIGLLCGGLAAGCGGDTSGPGTTTTSSGGATTTGTSAGGSTDTGSTAIATGSPDTTTGSVATTSGGVGTTGMASTTGDSASVTGGESTTGTTANGGSTGDPVDAGDTTGGQSTLGCRAPEPNPSAGNECHGSPPAALKLTEVASGLDEPTLLAHAPGDATRLFVLERGGRIRLIKDGALQPTAFLDLSSKVMTSGIAGERGLLGLAFAPDYATTRRFWVNYSANASRGGTVVASFVANEDGDSADPSSEQELFGQAQPAGNHNGGMLAFGPDGCLYIAMGDGGGSNDTYGNGQDDSSPLGGLLRVDVDNYQAATGAPGNMLSHPHMWDYGLRNPWRFSFDRESGDLYIGDVGQGAWEEVDVEPRGMGGRNYGWPCMEGFESGPGRGCDASQLTGPVAAQENNSTQNQSVIGGYVYRGSAIPSLVGRYLYADYNSRKIWSFTWKGDGEICDEVELTSQLETGGSISSFGEDENGELYVVVYNRGRILRIDPA